MFTNQAFFVIYEKLPLLIKAILRYRENVLLTVRGRQSFLYILVVCNF